MDKTEQGRKFKEAINTIIDLRDAEWSKNVDSLKADYEREIADLRQKIEDREEEINELREQLADREHSER